MLGSTRHQGNIKACHLSSLLSLHHFLLAVSSPISFMGFYPHPLPRLFSSFQSFYYPEIYPLLPAFPVCISDPCMGISCYCLIPTDTDISRSDCDTAAAADHAILDNACNSTRHVAVRFRSIPGASFWSAPWRLGIYICLTKAKTSSIDQIETGRKSDTQTALRILTVYHTKHTKQTIFQLYKSSSMLLYFFCEVKTCFVLFCLH